MMSCNLMQAELLSFFGEVLFQKVDSLAIPLQNLRQQVELLSDNL